MSSYAPLSAIVDTFNTPYDNVYQSSQNIKRSSVAVIQNTSIRNDLSSLNFGSTTTIELPQNILLQNSILVLTIAKESLPIGNTLERGWAYSALRRMTFQVSGSGQTLEMTGQALLVKNVADCESQGKIDRLMELAGEAHYGSAATKDYTAYINLYLPWGSVSSKRYLPYDASILRRPASLTIEMNDAKNIFSRGSQNVTAYPAAFKAAFVLSRTQILREPSPMPALFGVGTLGRYSHAYIYPQHQTVQNIAGKHLPSDLQSVDLRGFRSGNLQSIDCWLTRDTYDSTLPMSNSAHSRLVAYAPSNVRLLYGGQEIYSSDLDSSQIFNLCENQINLSWSATTFKYETVSVPTGGTPVDVNSSYLHIPIAQYNETVFCDLLQYGLDMISQNVQMRFNTPDPALLTPQENTGPFEEPKWTMHFNYNYLASVTTRGGDTQLEFIPTRLMA